VEFFFAGDRLELVGDVLFADSIGRADLPRGDHFSPLTSIRDKLWPLGADAAFVPVHGTRSTFGTGRISNVLFAVRDVENGEEFGLRRG
jgi:glyoxylase-like metal-dependent hydrolase (beta-lactamase superfamily II)